MTLASGSERIAFAPLQLHAPLMQLITALGSGKATLIHPAATRHVWFEAGMIVAVTSANDDEKLGNWLVSRGLLEAQTMRDALLAKPLTMRFGGVLVARALLSTQKLEAELATRSRQLLLRSMLAGGELTVEAGAKVMPDAHTADAPLRSLLIEATRDVGELEELDKLIGGATAWVSPEAEPAAADIDGLTETERCVFSLLKRPRALDNLRRASLIDYSDLLRALAVLASAGLVIPCKVTAVPPSSRSMAGADESGPTEPGAAPVVPGWTPLEPTATSGAGKRNIRAILDAVDAEEMASDPIVGGAGVRVPTSADYRRAQALTASARQLRETGGDSPAIRQMLLRAFRAYPGLKVTLELADLEIADAHLRSLALERLQKLLAQLPRCTEAWLLLARYWAERGQQDKVHACAAKILAYDPANENARALLEDRPN